MNKHPLTKPLSKHPLTGLKPVEGGWLEQVLKDARRESEILDLMRRSRNDKAIREDFQIIVDKYKE